jgi:plasmid stabilization system protein ParE
MRSVVVQPEAEQETDEAVAWYEEREPGLGLRLLHDLDVAYAAIARRPELFPPVGAGFRRALLRTFPYAVFFELDGDMVVVHSVFHCSRKPSIWKSRLRTAKKRRSN